MSLKVLNEHLVHAIGGGRVAARVAHGASAAVEVLPHDHGYLPQAGVGSRGARRDHAVVEEFVVEGVGPAGRSVLVDRHRRVVREVRLPQHFEHVVAADLKRAAPRFFLFSSLSLRTPSGSLTPLIDGSRSPSGKTRSAIYNPRANFHFFLFFFSSKRGNVVFASAAVGSLSLGFR